MRIFRSKIALTVILLLMALALSFVIFSKHLATALTRSIIRYKMAHQTINFDDGLYAVLCGTGSPLPDIERAGPCIAVVAGKHLYIVDAGEGSARNILLTGLQPGKIDSVFLTHFHSDHIASLGDIMLLHWSAGSNNKPLEVMGPQGVETVVNGFNIAYQLDKGYRIAHHGIKTLPPAGAGGIAKPFKLSAEENASVVLVDHDGVKITAFKVDHKPVFPAVGYRFDYKGRSMVISGDTSYSRSLLSHAKDADLLLHEALQASMVKMIHEYSDMASSPSIGKISADIPSYHSTPEDAARIAKEAGIRHLVLYHIIPPLPSSYILQKIFLGDARNFYEGPITVGVDGMLISLPANSREIKIKKLF